MSAYDFIWKSNSFFAFSGWESSELSLAHLDVSHSMIVEIRAGCEAFTANITLCERSERRRL